MSGHILVSTTPPLGFAVQVTVVAAYVEVNGRLLILQRNGSERGFWGVPAGKVESGELLEEAICRELAEETSIVVGDENPLNYLGALYMRKPTCDYIYHTYHLRCDLEPAVVLNSEHSNYGWHTLEEMRSMPLMAGAWEALAHCAEIAPVRTRT